MSEVEAPAAAPAETKAEPVAARPGEVRVVLLAHAMVPMTRHCVRSVIRHAGASIARLVVVDNGSEPNAKALFERLFRTGPWPNENDGAISSWVASGRLVLVRNEKNLDFGSACNAAAALPVEGKVEPLVLFLNNDTLAHSDFVAPMVDLLARKPEAAVVGAFMTVPETIHVQHSGVAFLEDFTPYHPFLGWDEDTHEANVEREWPAVTGACMLVRREDFDSVGGFCASIEPGKSILEAGFPFEDVDLCLRLLAKGRKTWFCPDARLEHHSSATVVAALNQSDEQTRAGWDSAKSRQLAFRKQEWAKSPIAETFKDEKTGVEMTRVAERYLGTTFQRKVGRSYIDAKVCIVTPISDDYYWCLDQFLACLEEIDYPKSHLRIVLLANNCGSYLIHRLEQWRHTAVAFKRFDDVIISNSPMPGPPGHEMIVKCRNLGTKVAKDVFVGEDGRRQPADVVFYWDCDLLMEPRSLRRLVRAVSPVSEGGDGADVATGVYCYKMPSRKPLLFRARPGTDMEKYLVQLYTDQAAGRSMGLPTTDEEHGLGLVGPLELAWGALEEGEVVDVDGIPFGMCAMNRGAYEIPLVAGQKTSGTEDLSWCIAARVAGKRIVAVTTEVAVHLSKGRAWIPAPPPVGEAAEAEAAARRDAEEARAR